MKRWMQKRSKVNLNKMAEALGIHKATAAVLSNRGIGSMAAAELFLNSGSSELCDPFLMKDMEKGVHIIKEAVDEQKKIVVYGDYDVDGVMSTSILYKAIRALGGNVSYYLPHRQQEGYGLNKKAVEQLVGEGAELIFTCDNGIAALEEIALARELGCIVVVLDHHEAPSVKNKNGEWEECIPIAHAVIDPKQKACSYPFVNLCAGGLAYQFARGLFSKYPQDNRKLLNEFLTLASVSTVCDIVDLLDENRILVKKGLENIKKSGNVGLNALLEATELLDKEITEYHLGFVIGPCINATGRLKSGEKAVALFCESDALAAMEYAFELVRLNNERKGMTLVAVKNVVDDLYKNIDIMDSVIVIYAEDVHESIAGIVAGRIKETFYHPVIVLTKGDDMVKGSGRSIEGYNLFLEMQKCKDLFSRFGGHAMAAGLSLPYENIEPLRLRLNEACTLTEEDMTAVLKIEAGLDFSEIDISLARELSLLSPFGKGNPTPLFGSKGIAVKSMALIGKNQDILKFLLYDPKSCETLPAISFQGYNDFIKIIKELKGKQNCDKLFLESIHDLVLDFVYQIDINSYRGRDSVQLIISDFRLPQ